MIAELSERQHGAVAHGQLVALGMSASAVQKRIASGRLYPLHRGVYAVGDRALPPKGRLMAAVLACGPLAMVSHRSAAAMRGVLDDSRAIVDVVAPRSRAKRHGIAVHRVRRIHPEDRDEIDGIPVTSLARTLLDLAGVVPLRRLVYAIQQAERMGAFDLRALERGLTRSRGHHGSRKLRAAVAEVHPEAEHSRSALEQRFLDFCRERDLPDPALNAVVCGFTVDALWEGAQVIVELDSWSHHRNRRAFEEDRRRDAKLRLARYTPLRVTWEWLTNDPDDLERTLLALLSEPPSRAATA